MKRLLCLFLALTVACSSGDDSVEEIVTYEFKLRNPYDRISFTQLSLPNYVFNIDGVHNEPFILDDGMPDGLSDLTLTLSYTCTVGGASYNKPITVTFIDDYTLVLDVQTITVCNPTIIQSYE